MNYQIFFLLNIVLIVNCAEHKAECLNNNNIDEVINLQNYSIEAISSQIDDRLELIFSKDSLNMAWLKGKHPEVYNSLNLDINTRKSIITKHIIDLLPQLIGYDSKNKELLEKIAIDKIDKTINE